MKTPEERFWKRVNKSKSCWEWTGNTSRGYGHILINGKYLPVHRFSYQIHNGEIPKGLHVCHSCDNTRCVNPQHLWLGTAKDNAIDRNQKKRNYSVVGERNGRAILSWKKVYQIREMYKTRKYSGAELGRMFGVGESTILYLLKGKSWKTRTL